MSGTELADEQGGYTLADGVEIAKVLDGKVDLIHVSTGGGHPSGGTVMHPSMFLPHGCNVYLAAEIKKHVSTPVATVGSLSEPDKMEQIIASGQADLVCMARALIADPYLPQKVMEGRPEDIRPCQRCYNCQGGMFVTRNMRCAVDPVIGNELRGQIPVPLTRPRKVLIAGGGPAGMVAAVTAAKRGHDVTLCEASDSLGGAIRYAKHVPFKKYLDDYLHYLIRQVGRAGVQVRLGARVTHDLAESLAPDVLIAAVGARPIVPKLPGMDLPHVVMGGKAHEVIGTLGQRVAIIGGGLVGTELAIHLADLGKRPVVLEMRGDYAVDSNPQHKNAIHWQKEHLIDFRLNTRVTAVTPEGLEAVDQAGQPVFVPADSVVVAVGYRADETQVEALRFTAPEFHWIGDCYRPGKVGDAVRMVYNTALDLCWAYHILLSYYIEKCLVAALTAATRHFYTVEYRCAISARGRSPGPATTASPGAGPTAGPQGGPEPCCRSGPARCRPPERRPAPPPARPGGPGGERRGGRTGPEPGRRPPDGQRRPRRPRDASARPRGRPGPAPQRRPAGGA